MHSCISPENINRQASSWTNRKDAQFVTDPNTGDAWLLGGALPDGSSTNEIDMWDGEQWNPNQPITPVTGASSAVLNNFSAGTAQLYNNKVYIFGGFSSTSGQRGYQSFQSIPWIDVSTSPPTYGTQLTLGAIPAARQDHCSVLTASHKVIIYGGYDANAKSTFADIWSLDLVTMTWSQIVPANPTSPRYRHNCAIAGANMIVYGGAATSATGPQTGYATDVQIYDVMLTSWMNSYTPKQDTTPISQPLGGGGPSNGGGLGVGPIVGIVAGVLVVAGCVLGFLYYKRRQKRIEIHEAELEKAAYLASLRPEGGDRQGKDGYMGTSVVSTPGMSHSGAYNGMDELLLNNGGGSPGMGGQGQNNVQYLMQHLPDGTIAVQPVYLDHQSVQTPNMRGATADDNAYVSPVMSNNSNGGGSSGGYFAPPPPSSNTSAQIHVASAVTSPYVLPPQQKPHVTYPQPSHDPFASPSMATTPLPPGYNPQSHSHSATLGLGSPQQMPDRLQ
ncbi:hypothetical protein BGZ98_006655 [Dissophora globulifera]|nr:hypothetical protein BGZ98_006655 [Dissophora globulifera]